MKILKKLLLTAGFCLCMAGTALAAEPVASEAYTAPPGDLLPAVTARSAVVMEAATGKVLYSRNMDERRYPASTTKIMTLIVALEQGSLDDMVSVSDNASRTEGSTIWLEPGEKMRMLDLLYGMMLVSGNDATVAVAEHVAGSVDAFARRMTAKAHEIGAVNTSFVNSSGLPDDRHYTTAHDLALIAAYGYKNPMFEQIVSTKERQIPWAKNDYNRDLRNENRMLWLYEGGNGVKTGYTDAAGRCLVSAAKRDGIQLVAVVLDSQYMWNDSIALLNYGFSKVHPVKLAAKNSTVKTVEVAAGQKKSLDLKVAEDLIVPAAEDEKNEFSKVIDTPDKVYAAVHKGDVIGQLVVMYDGRKVAAADLVAAESIEKKSFFAALYQGLTRCLHMVLA